MSPVVLKSTHSNQVGSCHRPDLVCRNTFVALGHDLVCRNTCVVLGSDLVCRSALLCSEVERFRFDYLPKPIIFLLLMVAIHSDTTKLKPVSYIDCQKVMDHWQMACTVVQDDMLTMK
jgi:hypothetical protein